MSEKEFLDHLISKRFFVLLAIICVILCVSAINGVNNYNNALDRYKAGSETEVFQPTAVMVFTEITNSIGVYSLGAIIGLALGFDLISGEREAGSLKTILSRPLYRDELINGKAIGGIISLAILTFVGFALVIATMLILGIVPDLEDISMIGIVWLLTILFILTAFSIAVMSSVIAKTSSEALMIALVITFVLFLIIPTIGGDIGTKILIGDPPEESEYSSGSSGYNEDFQEIQQEYYRKEDFISEFTNMFSARIIYNDLVAPLTWPSFYAISKLDFSDDISRHGELEKPSIWGIMQDKWIKIIVFLMWPVLFFGIAYVKFMRADLR
ncbi:ABC transporter permease [Methanolacinia petrolearia]|uniref:ABC transporter permease n=1 Tax=Methanolacinia petrolearia TaxID=54120 RepID=UPI001CDB3B0C|nr:ABC transporter permease subunit [Methanolacinia petrolearia]